MVGMSGLFIVCRKSNNEETVVYNVRDDRKGYAHFLVYDDGQWKYESAKHFVPFGNY